MSRYRLYPTPSQQAALLAHCAHARYVWNLAVEQHAQRGKIDGAVGSETLKQSAHTVVGISGAGLPHAISAERIREVTDFGELVAVVSGAV